jgi:hypothetical protein
MNGQLNKQSLAEWVYNHDKYSKLHTVRAVQLKKTAEEEMPACNKLKIANAIQ